MRARVPALDFGRSLPHWANNREFSQIFNAGSTSPSQIEPYLNKVMRRVRERLGPQHAELSRDIDVFIEQETQHYTFHNKFNAVVVKAGYPKIREYEARLRGDYKRFLEKKSLRFNCAYAEGFESMGLVYGRFYLEMIDDMLAGADPEVAGLWRWHFAEEYEHRNVAFQVLRAMGGGYFWRVYGLVYAVLHLGKYSKEVAAYLLEVDRANLDKTALAESKAREVAYRKRLSKFIITGLLPVLSPFYNPMSKVAPRGVQEVLEAAETRLAA